MTSSSNLVESPSTLVIGIGVGTFIIFFLVFLNIILWILSVAMLAAPKIITRAVGLLMLIIAAVILLFAKKEDHFVEQDQILIYDSTIIPRVAICMMMVIFAIVSLVFAFGIISEPKKLSTMDTDSNVLWQDQ